jgi:hypothetical protein
MGAAAMRRILFLAGAMLAISACGSREPLRPRSAEQTPVKPAMAATAPTTTQLLTPPPITRPLRQEEGLTRSEERKDDPFDLPPTR